MFYYTVYCTYCIQYILTSLRQWSPSHQAIEAIVSRQMESTKNVYKKVSYEQVVHNLKGITLLSNLKKFS